MENKQTPLTSTSGRGRLGRGSVHLILSFPALSAQSSADGVIPENRCHFSGIRKDRTEVPVPGTIPRTVIPVCGTGSLVLGKKTLVSSRYLPQPSYTRVSKWRSNVAVVVSTIAVKRSNRSAALLVEVWRKTNKQTPLTSTSGRGRFGRGSVHLILSFGTDGRF